MIVDKIGVIGAGVMGTGLAQSFAEANHSVILLDVSEDILRRAKQEIRDSLRLQRLLSKGQERLGFAEFLERITPTTDYNSLGDADFVIESVPENWEVKRQVFIRIDHICPSHAVFASNTSAISITRIGSVTRRAQRVLGLHFMNPVPMTSMVEVIRGYHTSEQTIETARCLLAEMGKECVVVADMPGFASNRVLMLMINEAIFVLQDQIASAQNIDRIFRSCMGHKMGPLETADLIGLDTILFSLQVLYESFNDTKFRPCPMLRKMVDAGLLGRKSGQGFYAYETSELPGRQHNGRRLQTQDT